MALSFDLNEKVAFSAPVNACDTHFHIFGPPAIYPYGSDELRYAPPFAPLADYLQLARHLGLTRYVFVQPSAYGLDNRCMLDAMQTVGNEACRGIVDIDAYAPDSVLAEMDTIGVRGVRINYSPVHPVEAGLGLKMAPRIRRIAARCQELGWHLDFLLPGWLTTELIPLMQILPVPFSLAHMGMNLAKDGVQSPGFQALLDLINHGERNAYVKLTGIYRMSTTPGFTDADALAQALIQAAPDRLIWGSDYPHLSFGENSSVALFNLLARWTSDTNVHKLILADNPEKLFGF